MSDDHKIFPAKTRKGRRLVSFDGLAKVHHGWAEDVVPELIWLALMIGHLGLPQTAQFLQFISGVIREEVSDAKFFGAMSVFGKLLSVTDLVDRVRSAECFAGVSLALKPLTTLWPHCLISPVFDLTDTPSVRPIDTLKGVLEQILDKDSNLAHQCIAMFLRCEGWVRPEFLSAELDSAISDVLESSNLCAHPEATFLRAAQIGAFGMLISTGEVGEWSKEFWAKCFSLEPIDYSLVLK